MTRRLAPATIERYRCDGIVTPVAAIGSTAAAGLLDRLEALERDHGGRLPAACQQKPYLLLTWLAALIRDPAILNPVEDLLGPDILCWAGSFFIKNPGDGAIVTWHQDSTYWGLSTPDVVTAWVALTPSTVESGCMRVIPGSQTADQLPHRDTFAAHNLLSRGQEIAVTVDEDRALDVVLDPGQMSLHHVRLIHGSGANQASHRRIGIAIRYVATHVRQVAGSRDSATLVRGTDRYGNFEPEPTPVADFDDAAMAYHAAMRERTSQFLYRDAARGPRN